MKQKVVTALVIAAQAAFIIASVHKYGGWGIFLVGGGAGTTGFYWMLSREKQNARIRRLKKRIHKKRQELKANMEAEERQEEAA